ncbi:MAG: hypothetical protein K8T90_10775 [Planctomycetes bacterium]|nr:hypothetical protein [Planctomycetota bacterium]
MLTSHHPWHEPPALLTAGVLMAPVLFAGATSVLFDGGEDFLQRHVAVLTWPAMVGAWVVGTAFCIAFFPLEIVAAAHNDEQTYNYVEPNPDFVPENYVPPTPDAEPMQRPD